MTACLKFDWFKFGILPKILYLIQKGEILDFTYFTGSFRLGDFRGFLKIRLLGVLQLVFFPRVGLGVAVIIRFVGVANMVLFACLFPEDRIN